MLIEVSLFLPPQKFYQFDKWVFNMLNTLRCSNRSKPSFICKLKNCLSNSSLYRNILIYSKSILLPKLQECCEWPHPSPRLRGIALDAFSSTSSHKDSLIPKTQTLGSISHKKNKTKNLFSSAHVACHTQIRVLQSVEFLVLGVTNLVIVAIQATQQKKEHNYSKNPTI